MRELISRLGKESDSSLAAKFGITRQRVGEIRKANKIPVYKSEFREDNKVIIGTAITKADARDMKRAMKKTGDKRVSKYVRGAVRKMNKEVLG
jgi:hypothetical protein